MIACLNGTLIEKNPHSSIVDVNGVGYEVFSSLETYQRLPEVNEPTTLLVYTHVRETEIVLFGFYSQTEKQLFQLLIQVNGVGPKLALNILSGIATEELIRAITSGDIVRMTSIPGVGKKTAERLILDLKDKITKLSGTWSDSTTPAAPTVHDIQSDLISVLQNLGYKTNQAEKAVQELHFDEDTPLQEAVRQTLKHLAGKQRKAG